MLLGTKSVGSKGSYSNYLLLQICMQALLNTYYVYDLKRHHLFNFMYSLWQWNLIFASFLLCHLISRTQCLHSTDNIAPLHSLKNPSLIKLGRIVCTSSHFCLSSSIQGHSTAWWREKILQCLSKLKAFSPLSSIWMESWLWFVLYYYPFALEKWIVIYFC